MDRFQLLSWIGFCGLLKYAAAATENSFHFSNVFGSHMVLQHSKPAPIWGWDTAGSEITLEFNGAKYSAKSDDTGFWKIILSPMAPSLQAFTISVTNSAGQSLALNDVLFGDVVLCSGQSNMEYTLNFSDGGAEEVQNANNYPNIRIFSGPLQQQYNLAGITEDFTELGAVDLQWSVASNSSVARVNQNDWDYFSAVCWHTIRHIFEYQNGTVPVGGVVHSYGGTSVQYWSSSDAISACSAVYSPGTDCCGFGGSDSCLYRSQIAPYTLGPTQFKQVLWLQGEQNAGAAGYPGIDYYACGLPAMISDWRAKLQQEALSFGIILLAPWTADNSPWFGLTRQIQIATSLSLSNVYVVNSLDQGDAATGDIHSPYKSVVGYRAALGSQSVAYGDATAKFRGPRAISATTKTNLLKRVHTVEVEFDQTTLYDGTLLLNNSVACPAAINPLSCESFAVLSKSDCQWYSVETHPEIVTAAAEGNKLTLTVHDLSLSIAGVRGLFANWPVAKLSNNQGIPSDPWLFTDLAENTCEKVGGPTDLAKWEEKNMGVNANKARKFWESVFMRQ